jgi:rhomboid protease GluP
VVDHRVTIDEAGGVVIRKKEGSVVCPSCRRLVGVNDEVCYNCGRRNPGMWGFAPFLTRLGDLGFDRMVIWVCVVLYIGTLAFDPAGIRPGGMGILAPGIESLFLFGASGAVPVFGYGRWWTVLSAAWLHGGVIHILFNMLWVRQLAPATSHLYGSNRMIIIYTFSSITGFMASSFAGAFFRFLPSFIRGSDLTVGASAPIFGLLGALIYYGRRSGSSMIGDQARMWALILFVFGFLMPRIDNWAHLGGFIGGYLISSWLDPLKHEKLDHLLIALGCILATGLAILISIITGFRWIS